ncbi:MAG: 2'-5' RNA ligase family protein [Marmoricola sp.]
MEDLPITGIVIPVAEADRLVRSRTGSLAPRQLPGTGPVPAHITLLAPFLPEAAIDDTVLGRLADFFADVTPFDFELTEVCEFPGGITYLAPEPAATFRLLTAELHRMFPEFPPYGGTFDDVVPHLTVPLEEGETTTSLRSSLSPGLPLALQAREAVLLHTDETETRVIAHLQFGTTAA